MLICLPVCADQANVLAFQHAEGDVLEDGPVSESVGKMVYG